MEPGSPQQSPSTGGDGREARPADSPRDASNTGSRGDSISSLGRQLGGDLPCIVCGYNLKGLSIRGACPECSATVRVTLMAVTDPESRVLQPLTRPRMVAGGVIAWMAGGLGAALVCWLPHLQDLFELTGFRVASPRVLRAAALVLLCVSGIGASALIRPHAKIPAWQSVAAALAVGLYVPLGWLLHAHLRRHDILVAGSVLTDWHPTWSLTREVVGMSLLVAAIIMLQRPNVRLLVARSLLLRTGRVDRQTLWAMAVAAVVIAIGQIVGKASIGSAGLVGNIGVTFGLVLMVVGAGLLTIGLLGGVIDAVRIARAIVRPTHTVKQVVRTGLPPSSTVR